MESITLGAPAETGWASFLPLLHAALEVSPGPVLELGAGDSSTPLLHAACAGKRTLVTMDSNLEWLQKYRKNPELNTPIGGENGFFHSYLHTPDWDAAPLGDFLRGESWGVALVDHAPGEARVGVIRRLAQVCGVLVVHDTEPGQARAGYGYDAIWDLFRFGLHDDRLNTWATALSNTVDLTKWDC